MLGKTISHFIETYFYYPLYFLSVSSFLEDMDSLRAGVAPIIHSIGPPSVGEQGYIYLFNRPSYHLDENGYFGLRSTYGSRLQSTREWRGERPHFSVDSNFATTLVRAR